VPLGAALKGAALTTPQICLQEFEMKKDHGFFWLNMKTIIKHLERHNRI